MVETESAAPNFGAELLQGLLGGEVASRRRLTPLGPRQPAGRRVVAGALGSEEQEGVSSDAEGRGGFHRLGGADLGLADAQQGFLVAKVDFDAPTMQVGFDEAWGGEVRVSAKQKGGLAVEQLGALAQAITKGSDDDQLQHLARASRAPHQAGATLEAQLVGGPFMDEGEDLPGRIVLANLFGRGSGRAVAEAAAAPFTGGRIGWEEQLGILADAADGGGVVGQVFKHRLIGIAAIEGDEEPAGGGGRVGIESGAQLADLLDGALAEAGGARGEAVFLLLGLGGLLARLGGSRGMAKGDGDDAAVAWGRGQQQRSLEKALGAHEIGLKVRSQRVAAPGDAGGAEAGA